MYVEYCRVDNDYVLLYDKKHVYLTVELFMSANYETQKHENGG